MTLSKRILGRTGLEVTQLGYGAMEVRGERIWGGRPCGDEEARDILNAVVDAGINFIDTANDYGKSELYIGRHLAQRRAEFILATKCGCHMQFAGDHDDTPHHYTRDNVLRNIADSLLKMETDCVEVLQLHGPPVEDCEKGGLVEVLQELKKAGVVKFIGNSSTLPHLPTYIDWGVFDVFQIPYSALERRHENWITKAAEAGAGIIIRGGVAKGEPGEAQGIISENAWQTFEKAKLRELCEEGESATSFILRFTLTHPHCHTTIVGTKQRAHLEDNLATAARGPLPDDVYAEAKKRLDSAGESAED
jgi:aryl-alcohol dehydrogenase-like predicted oxidoreductase